MNSNGKEKHMTRCVVSNDVSDFADTEIPDQRYTAVMFRGRVYVAAPRHFDAINLAFAGMTPHQKHRVSNRIADGQETMLFGSARSDGSEWKHDSEYQNARMKMYGFD